MPLLEPWNGKSKNWVESKNIQQLAFASGRPESSDLCDRLQMHASGMLFPSIGGELIIVSERKVGMVVCIKCYNRKFIIS